MKKKLTSIIQNPFLALFVSLILTSGCKKEEDIQPLSLSYDSKNIEIAFWSSGEITAPEVYGALEAPTFSLKYPLDGLEINAITGALSWNNLLGIGIHEITVVAHNADQRAETNLIVESTLGGTQWQGGQNNDTSGDSPLAIFISREFVFNSDGTLSVSILNEDGSEGVGVWTMEDDQVSFRLCYYCPDKDPRMVPEMDEHALYTGVITNYGLEGATLHGQWSVVRFNPDSVTVRGQFFMNLMDNGAD